MRSIQLLAPGVLEEREMLQPPDPGHGEITVRIRAVGVCGSDLHWYQDGRIGEIPAVYPQVLGHEPAGEVIAVGPSLDSSALGSEALDSSALDSSTAPPPPHSSAAPRQGADGGSSGDFAGHFSVGDRVVIEPTLTCGHCEFCLRGQHNHCVRGAFLGGPQAPGLFREYVTLPAGNCTRIPDRMDYGTATLAEPLAVMVHMLELIEIRAGDTVAVTGAGPIGMLCAAIARASGAGRVFIADRLPHRLKLAIAMGADVAIDTTISSLVETVMDATRGRGADVVLEAAGSPDTVNAAIRMARMGGTAMLIGIPSALNPKIDIHTAMMKELRLQTLKRSNHRTQQALDLLAAGRIPTSLITHTLPLAGTPRAFEMLTNYSDGVGKAIIEL
jgi:threonine dehydrogenase-like Zn-dependent dehydrogenase